MVYLEFFNVKWAGKEKKNIIKAIFKFLDNKSEEQVSKTKSLESNY